MLFGLDQVQLAFIALVAVATGSAVLAIALPLLPSSGSDTRIKGLSTERRAATTKNQPTTGRLIDGPKDGRRKQIQESIKQVEIRSRERKGRVSLRLQIIRAGLDTSVARFWLISGTIAVLFLVLPPLLGFSWYIGMLGGITAFLGFPRWFLSGLAKRRQKAFIEDLADALDVMVRGLKAGLPLSDAMRVIAAESGPPVGPEFMEVVEGQRLGITIDQGLERMFERMPLPEVSFLGIVISIQSKAGGNLSEALGNLSRLLRERKKMKGKIRSLSQEAKSSAAIIGVLPFFIAGALLFINPSYLQPLFASSAGHMILAGAGFWMLCGMLIMRSMINFDI
ncbi:type II secretion system F family protein [Aestuariivirga sp.]|uniref:type II secretion system F family protein n=1 Tax=Aestuariivirga sp. TaxID=2650926 RepID=UPI0030169369